MRLCAKESTCLGVVYKKIGVQSWWRFWNFNIYFVRGSTAAIGPGLLIVEASRSHSDTPHSFGLLWTSDQPDAETSSWQYTTLKRQTSMPPAGFEPTILASEQPQIHGLDRAATEIGDFNIYQDIVLSGLYVIDRSGTGFKSRISPHSLSVRPSYRTAYFRTVICDLISWYTVIKAVCWTSHSSCFKSSYWPTHTNVPPPSAEPWTQWRWVAETRSKFAFPTKFSYHTEMYNGAGIAQSV